MEILDVEFRVCFEHNVQHAFKVIPSHRGDFRVGITHKEEKGNK